MNTAQTPCTPIILGADVGAYSIARAFHEAYRVRSVAFSQRRSRLCETSSIMEVRRAEQMDIEEVFLHELGALAEERPNERLMLLPCADWYVRLIAANRSALERRFIITSPDAATLRAAAHKDAFCMLCRQLGIPHPATTVVELPDGLDAFRDAPPYPLYVKPAVSADWHGMAFEGKRKVYRAEDERELEEVLTLLACAGFEGRVVLQETVEGDDTCLRVLTTYSDRFGHVCMASLGQVLAEDGRPLALGNHVAIKGCTDEGIVADAIHLLEHIGYTGFANFDIKIDARTGRHHFLELNARLGRSNYHCTAGGQNIAMWLVADLIERRIFDPVCTTASDGWLYSLVSRRTLLRQLSDDAGLRADVRRLCGLGMRVNPIDCSAEDRLVRRLYARVFEQRQKRVLKGAKASFPHRARRALKARRQCREEEANAALSAFSNDELFAHGA